VKKTFVLVLAFAACVASAGPALAKGDGDFPTNSNGSINGPGLRGPIHMSFKGDCGVVYACQNFLDYNNPLVSIASLTGLTGFPGGWMTSYIGSPPPASQLGPRYRFTVTASSTKTSETVVQDLYPFAGSRGWIYTPKGQSIYGRPLHSGWLPAPFTLRAALIAVGIPAHPPIVAPVSGPTASPERSPSPLLLGAALLAALALGGVVLAVRANRRDLPRPA
jgi:hypothetical protein